MSTIPAKPKLADGLWDHGPLITRPRIFVRRINFLINMSWLLLIPAFGCAMAAVIIQETNPLWIRQSFTTSSSTPRDSAIFFSSNGEMDVRVCGGDGRFEYTCDCCNCGDDNSEYSNTNYAVAPSEDDDDRPKIRSKFEDINNDNFFSSATSKRYNNPQTTCECGYTIHYNSDKCPSTNASAVFPRFDRNTNCKGLLDGLRTVFASNLVWVALGMFFQTVVAPIALVIIKKCYSESPTHRYLAPTLGHLYVVLFGIVHYLVAYIMNLVVILTARDLSTQLSGLKAPVTPENSCGVSNNITDDMFSLYDNGFRDEGIFMMWQCGVAGCVLSFIPLTVLLIGVLSIWLQPIPQDINTHLEKSTAVGMDYRLETCCSWHFPDYESDIPEGGERIENAPRPAVVPPTPDAEDDDNNSNDNTNNSAAQIQNVATFGTALEMTQQNAIPSVTMIGPHSSFYPHHHLHHHHHHHHHHHQATLFHPHQHPQAAGWPPSSTSYPPPQFSHHHQQVAAWPSSAASFSGSPFPHHHPQAAGWPSSTASSSYPAPPPQYPQMMQMPIYVGRTVETSSSKAPGYI